jgi:hypothetical protein
LFVGFLAGGTLVIVGLGPAGLAAGRVHGAAVLPL